ncbi:protein C2-DOMAIN ABA-RELATED 7-like isoform X2 [Rhododendron vialii]|uniref:protein C2-DOMAIN ABA-RELATED 7-like isoform X2 n=1 Tax=Rhododendron vialii TaxID=182163 RepID=UPI00265E627B|nr:protein C2-DOMAIN ABA-RELATED 7-like isoform X2 [Rhododendron vialii]
MEDVIGLLRIRVRRGINLVARDTRTSDSYVVITRAQQKVKTDVVKNTCNPKWNDELTLSITDANIPILLRVYDKDTFTSDDKMGDVEIDIKPYLECMKMELQNLPTGTVVDRVQPNSENCLGDESCITWNNGKLVQDMSLRLRNVEHGEVEIQIEWIALPGSKGSRNGSKGSRNEATESLTRPPP